MKVKLYLILILASCVAINHGLKCLVCTSVEHGVDCDKNPANFSVECPEDKNACQMSGKLGTIGRSCSQSDNDDDGVDHKILKPRCTPNPDGSCSCNTDNCNDTPGPDPDPDPDDGDKSSTAGGGPGGPDSPGGGGTTNGGGDPKNDPTKGPSGPQGPADPSSAQSNKNFKFLFFCLLFITLTIIHLY